MSRRSNGESTNLAPEDVRIVPVTAGRALGSADMGRFLEVNPAGGVITLSVPANLFRGWNTTIIQVGTGTVTLAAGLGATLRSVGGALNLAAQWAGATIYCRGSSEYVVNGSLV